MKGIDFSQYYSPVLAPPTLRLVVAVAVDYHLTIGIVDVNIAFQNTLKDSSYHDIIDCPIYYIVWFKLCFPTISIEPDPDGRYIM